MITLVALSVLGLAAGARPLPQVAAEPDTALVAAARAQPDSAREALRRTLVEAGAAAPADSALAEATRLARAWAIAWQDSFPVRQVARFASWSANDRRVKLAADSLRRAGNGALGREGLEGALRDWRESVRLCVSISDSAGLGAGLGNIGAGFYVSDELDSAARYLRRASAVAAAIGDWHTEGNAVGTLAALAEARGDARAGAELYARAAELRVRTGDDRGAAADRNNLGLLAEQLGDLRGARKAFMTALASNRRGGRDMPAAVNLTNLANLDALESNFTQAESRYREALAIYEKEGAAVDASGVLRDLGLLALQRGDYAHALTHFVSALRTYRRTGPPADEVAVRRDVAITHAAMGNLQGALIQLDAAERVTIADSGAIAALALARGDLAMEFNEFRTAQREYERSARLAQEARAAATEAEAQSGLGELLALRHDLVGATDRLERALRAQETAGDRRAAALTRLRLADVQAQRGDTMAARVASERALTDLRAIGDAAGEGAAYVSLGALAAQLGRAETAEARYRRGLAALDGAHAPSVAWRLHHGLAMALELRGARDEEERELRAAVREIERAGGSLALEERRSAFLSDKWEVYAQLARVEIARGDLAGAFDASERLRARELLDLLARGRVSPARGTRSGALQTREAELRRQADILTVQLEGSAGTLRGSLAAEPTDDAAREALSAVQQEYSDLLRRMKEVDPRYAAAVAGTVVSLSTVQRALARDAVLLEYLLGDSTSLVFIITHDSAAVATVPIGRHALAKLVTFARGVLAKPSVGADEPWRAPLRRLHQLLIEPAIASRLLAGKRTLVVVPQGELNLLPYSALLGGSGATDYLIETFDVASMPSASVWMRLRARTLAPNEGVLALAPRVDALPGTREEVGAIERSFGARAHVLVGAQATKLALRESASAAGIIHFATYGVLNKDNPLFSFVELAPSEGSDGRLEVHEVFGLPLRARLVVLSACQTAVGAGALEDVPSGDDWVGLVQAFHSAGAANVLAALWPVDDHATAQLMTQMYGALAAGRGEAESLADAQRTMMRKKETAHPFYWAAFTMSGAP